MFDPLRVIGAHVGHDRLKTIEEGRGDAVVAFVVDLGSVLRLEPVHFGHGRHARVETATRGIQGILAGNTHLVPLMAPRVDSPIELGFHVQLVRDPVGTQDNLPVPLRNLSEEAKSKNKDAEVTAVCAATNCVALVRPNENRLSKTHRRCVP